MKRHTLEMLSLFGYALTLTHNPCHFKCLEIFFPHSPQCTCTLPFFATVLPLLCSCTLIYLSISLSLFLSKRVSLGCLPTGITSGRTLYYLRSKRHYKYHSTHTSVTLHLSAFCLHRSSRTGCLYTHTHSRSHTQRGKIDNTDSSSY